MASKIVFGIDIDVKVGQHGQYGLTQDFVYQRKVSGCVSMRDAAQQTLSMLQELAARLEQQLDLQYPQLTNSEDEES